jgi:hypothetical protein
MNNIDSIIYTKNLISILKSDDFFNEDENPFMDEELFYDEVLKFSSENLSKHGKPEISEDQFDEALLNVRKVLVSETFDEMVDDGLLEPIALDNDGNMMYSLNQEFKDELEKKEKKNK